MGIHIVRRAYYPSGPWIDGIRPPGYVSPSDEPKPKNKQAKPKLPNPDPTNYKITQAAEIDGYLLIKLNYPDCTNFEGNKILLFQGVTLIDLVNQKAIDPHFFEDKKYASPVARFTPTEAGWEMGLKLIRSLTKT